jgi:hypothetical protein
MINADRNDFMDCLHNLLLKRRSDLQCADIIKLLKHEYLIMYSEEDLGNERIGYIVARFVAQFLVSRYINLSGIKNALINKRRNILFNVFVSRSEIVDQMLCDLMLILNGDKFQSEVDIDIYGINYKLNARLKYTFAKSDADLFNIKAIKGSYMKRYKDFVELLILNSNVIVNFLEDFQYEQNKLDGGCHVEHIDVISKHFSVVMSEMAFLSEAVEVLLKNIDEEVYEKLDKSAAFYKIKGIKKLKSNIVGNNLNAKLIKVLHSLAFSRQLFGSLSINVQQSYIGACTAVIGMSNLVSNKKQALDSIFDIDIGDRDVVIDKTRQ